MPSASGAVLALAFLTGLPVFASAQRLTDSGTVRVRVVADSTPVRGAFVRAAGRSTQTNAIGEATLRLPVGTHSLIVGRLGFKPDTLTVLIVAGGEAGAAVVLEPQAAVADRIIVSATRTERRIEDVPLKVEVLAREEVEEKMLMTPGDISMMLNETGGLRVQTTSPSLGAANVRMQGLRGRYTLMLADGLPLYGGQTGSLGLLQIPPMDLAQVEVIKGVASALYGASALGGVVNLISRRPREDAEHELLLNQTTRGGTDGVLWFSRPVNERFGYTLLGGVHRQSMQDVDADGWADMPEYHRTVVRPRLFWTGDRGRNGMVTIGATIENRDGGTLPGELAPDGAPFAERLDTRRVDGGGVLKLPFGGNVLSARGSASVQRHSHGFGPIFEHDRHATTFGEASFSTARGPLTWVVGAAAQFESFESDQVPRFNYAHSIPGGFAQMDIDPAPWLAVSASGRVDAHSEFGTVLNPRVSVLVRSGSGWTARLSGGTGVFAPTPFTEETEATGLSPLRALPSLSTERGRGASLDLGGHLGPLELNATVFASSISSALVVRSVASSPTELEMLNASLATRTAGADALLRYRASGVVTTLSYTRVKSTEETPTGGARRVVPLSPAHTAGLVSVWEVEGVQRVGVEVYYTGRQQLDENPYLTESKPYVSFGAIAERHFGRARVFVNLENLGGARMTRYQPLPRPTRGDGGRWTTDAWGPTEGRTVNAGMRLGLGSRE